MEKQDLLVSLTIDQVFYLARSSLGRCFFVFFTQGLFSVKGFHVGIFVKCVM